MVRVFGSISPEVIIALREAEERIRSVAGKSFTMYFYPGMADAIHTKLHTAHTLKTYTNTNTVAPGKRHTIIDAIIATVRHVTGMSLADLQKVDRHREYVEARSLYCWLCRKVGGMTFKAISESIKRDHTCVIHLVSRIDNFMNLNDEQTVKMITIALGKYNKLTGENVEAAA